MKLSVLELAERCGVSVTTIRRRIAEGCSQEDIIERPSRSREKDLTGKVFDRLTVLKRCRHKGRSWWACSCACGNRNIVSGYELESGHTRSCGCLKIEQARATFGSGVDLTGRRFGKLTVVASGEKKNLNGRRERVWQCQCDCGTIVDDVLTGYLVVTGARFGKKSCGCLKGDKRRRFNVCGEMLNMEEMAELTNVSPGTIFLRLKLMSPIEVVSTLHRIPGPKRGTKTNKYFLRGKRVTLKKISELSGISITTIIKKIRDGNTVEEIIASGHRT